MTPKRTQCIVIGILGGLLAIVSGIVVVLYFRSLVDLVIESQLPLREGAEPTNLWLKPPVTPYLKVYFFNVTNPKEFLEQGAKLKLKEFGPYTYSEKWEKVNVTWHPNGTMSYRQKKQFYFVREMSIGPESDEFTVPNVPMLSAVGQLIHATKFARKTVATLLDILKLHPFGNHSVKELMWGYEDPLIKLGKSILPEGKRVPFDKFGFFYNKNFTSYENNDGVSDEYTVWTGAKNLQDYARINVFNGKEGMSYWGTEECNKIKGTDGTGFSSSLKNDSSIHLFNKDLCQSIHLTVKEEVKRQGFTALRFYPVESTFGDIETYPENECYCVGGPPCAKKGTFNISACQLGSPVFLSWPHFLHGDKSLVEAIDGLAPRADKHQFYIDIQPRLGIAMQAKARVQINIQMAKIPDIPQTINFTNLLLPVIWFEDGIDELPDSVTGLLGQAINLPPIAEAALSYILFIVGGLLCIGGCLLIIRKKYAKKAVMNSNGHAKEGEKNGISNGKGREAKEYTVEMDESNGKGVKNGSSSVKTGETKESSLS